MENNILQEMDGYQLLDTLQATSRDLDFANDFAQVYEEILTRAQESKDLSFLKQAQGLRWKQTEYLLQEWLENYEPPKTTHSARFAGC